VAGHSEERQFSRFSNVLRLSGHIPYGLGSRIIAAAGKLAPIRRFLLGRRWKVLQSVLPDIAPQLDILRTEQICLAANTLIPWRANALSRCSAETFDRWVRVSGLEHIESACRAGKGIVLVSSHFCLNRLVPLVMLRKGYTVNAMEPEPWLLRMGVKGAEAIPVIDLRAGDKFWLKELFRAKRVLDEGKILHLAVDGLQGRQGRKAMFLGKEREFYISFAELATKTKAAAIAVFASTDPAGVVTIEILPALRSCDDAISHEVNVKQLVDQYVALLESRWKTDLGNVVPKHLLHFAKLPAMTQDIEGLRHMQLAAVDN
jgi:KDO2-lipid IV(A) lauroyltransferase